MQDEDKQLLLLMDTDKNGKISKKEFMAFMSAEFDRLDTDKSGETDAKGLKQATGAAQPAGVRQIGRGSAFERGVKSDSVGYVGSEDGRVFRSRGQMPFWLLALSAVLAMLLVTAADVALEAEKKN